MMEERLSPRLQDLHAFVDGQLGPNERHRVETLLTDDEALRNQARAYAQLRDDLHRLYDPVLREPVPASMLRARRGWGRPLRNIAAGLALLATGTWLGIQLGQQDLPIFVAESRMVRDAAMAYAVYTPEVRHPVEVTADQEAHLVAWLTKRMGAQVDAPDLSAKGFLLVGGRLLSGHDGPNALFMYEHGDGRRIVMHIAHNPRSRHNTAFRFGQREGVSVFYWYDGPLSYALAGELDRQGLLSLAEAVYDQISI